MTAVDLFAGPRLAPDAPTGLGQMMAGFKRSGLTPRRALDYYPTPVEATEALIAAERAAIVGRGQIWEPCGRGGAIAQILNHHSVTTVATDIVADPTNAVAAADLLAVKTPLARRVVTNMPFAIARPMIVHLWETLAIDYMALLFKASFMNCDKAADLWRAGLGNTRRWDLSWRLDFTGGGRPVMDCAWFIWDRLDPTPHIGVLDRNGPVTPRPTLIRMNPHGDDQ